MSVINPIVLSVIIPTHNRRDLLSRALRSVLDQADESVEVIVVDDGGTDDTRAFLEGLGDPRVRYLYQENSGPSVARNYGASQARGARITTLDSDDLALPGWVDAMCIDADVVSCGSVKSKGPEASPDERVTLPHDRSPAFYSVHGHFKAGTYSLRLERFRETEGYDPRAQRIEHGEFSIRIAQKVAEEGWTIEYVHKPLARIIDHDDGHLSAEPHSQWIGMSRLLELHPHIVQRDPGFHADYCAVSGVRHWRMGQRADARSWFRKAIKIKPSNPKHWARVLMSTTGTVPGRVWKTP